MLTTLPPMRTSNASKSVMPRSLHVHLLPALFEPSDLNGGIAVVIDVLRATTTLAHAFANGARRVVPCETIEQAREVRNLEGDHILLGGERKGELIPGFDLDNSPTAWSQDVVADRDIAFTTTNGTRALLRSIEADRIVTAAFANLSATIRLLLSDDRPINIVCAGTDGHIAAEDSLLAGAIVGKLQDADDEFELNDSARLVLGLWESNAATETQRLAAIQSGRGGTNVTRIGMTADIETAAEIDRVDLVPEFLPESADLRPAAS